MKNKLPKNSTVLLKGLSGLLFFMVLSITAYSQNVGISPTGVTPPDPSAGLDINYSTQGLLVPRVALVALASSAPLTSNVAGMIVYNTSNNAELVPGFYYNDGTRWISGLPQARAAGDLQYWDGTNWVNIPIGQPDQKLQLGATGIPVWSGAGYADLTTATITNLTSTSATSGGNVTNNGGTAVSAFGVCWATTPNPTIAGSFVNSGSGTGIFTSNVAGLVTGTIYYLRAYATNSTGTSYGNQIIFTTP